MQKLLYLFIVCIFVQTSVFAGECSYKYECRYFPEKENTFSSIFSQMTGIDYFQIRAAEYAAEKYIEQKSGNNVSISISARSGKALRNGEFEEISARAEKLYVKQLVLTDFKAKTLCPHNKVIINNNDYKFPYDLPAEFSAYILSEDFESVLMAYIDSLGYNVNNLYNLNFVLANSKLYVAVSHKLIRKNYSFVLDVRFIDGKLYVSEAEGSQSSTYLKQLINYINNLPPLEYKFKMAKNTYGYISIDDLFIAGDKIYLKGLFIIPQNCDIK